MLKSFAIGPLALLLLCGMSFAVQKTTPSSRSNEISSFEIGEKLSYELVYNWGVIWVSAGYVDFEVLPSTRADATYHFKSFGSSYKKWDWFYKVRSSYESHTDEFLKPLVFTRKGKEGPHMYDREYVANEQGFMYYNSENRESLKSKQVLADKETFDVISAIYHCRQLDFSDLEVDDTIPLTLMLDGTTYPTYLRYKGKEQWRDRRADTTYSCIVFKPRLIDGTIFSSGENMTVYVTDDEKRIPVYIETELVVGKGKVYLK